jgi:threonyl-tRNA synthetase
MIHCAIMGSIERFMSTLIEHLSGNFPLWLSPIQVCIVPIGESQKEYSNKVFEILKEKNIRVKLDDFNESLGKRIRNAKTDKTPYVIVLGDKEKDSETLTVETRSEKIENIKVEDFIAKIEKEISEKTLN